MSPATATAVLTQVGALPQVRLEPRAGAVTAVVFHTRTIALLDDRRRRAEVAVSVHDRDRLLAEHREAMAGPNGVAVALTSPHRVRTAVELIRRGIDEAMYRWQLTSASP